CRIGARSTNRLGTRNCTTDEERCESQARNSTQTIAKRTQCCVHDSAPVIRAGSLLRLRANSAAWRSIVEQEHSALLDGRRRYWGQARRSINCVSSFALAHVQSRCYPRLASASFHLDGDGEPDVHALLRRRCDEEEYCGPGRDIPRGNEESVRSVGRDRNAQSDYRRLARRHHEYCRRRLYRSLQGWSVARS